MMGLLKFILGICTYIIFLVIGDRYGNKKYDNYMLFFIFASFGIRNFFCVVPENIEAIRYLQGSWYLYLYDIPLIYFGGRKIKYGFKSFPSSGKVTERFAYLFAISAFLSIFQAINKSSAFWGAIDILKFIWIYFIMKSMVNLVEQRKYILRGIMVSVWFQGCIALLQKIKGGVIGLSFLGETEIAFRIREVGGVTSMGIAGTFAHSADFAIFMLFAITILLFNEDYIDKIKLLPTIAVALITLYFAESRTVLGLSLIVFGAYYLKGLKRKISIWQLLITLGGPIIVLIVWIILSDRIMQLFGGNDWIFQISNRLAHWKIGWNEIIQKPIVGHGINNYTDWMRTLYPELYSYHFYYTNPIHNSYLQIWYDTGIIGLIAYVFMLISCIVYFIRVNNKSSFKIVGFLFVCITMVYFWSGWALLKEPITNMLWISMGLLHNNTDYHKKFIFEKKRE